MANNHEFIVTLVFAILCLCTIKVHNVGLSIIFTGVNKPLIVMLLFLCTSNLRHTVPCLSSGYSSCCVNSTRFDCYFESDNSGNCYCNEHCVTNGNCCRDVLYINGCIGET